MMMHALIGAYIELCVGSERGRAGMAVDGRRKRKSESEREFAWMTG